MAPCFAGLNHTSDLKISSYLAWCHGVSGQSGWFSVSML